MVQHEIFTLIDITNFESRASHAIATAQTAGQTTHQRRLAAAQITNQLNNLTPLESLPELLAEPLGSVGAGRDDC